MTEALVPLATENDPHPVIAGSVVVVGGIVVLVVVVVAVPFTVTVPDVNVTDSLSTCAVP